MVVTEFALDTKKYNQNDIFTMNDWKSICKYFIENADKMGEFNQTVRFDKYPVIKKNKEGDNYLYDK